MQTAEIIQDERQLARLTDVLEELTSLEKPSLSQIDLIKVLSAVIMAYEALHYPFPQETPTPG